MSISDREIYDQFDLSFKVFHELMAGRVNEILLVSSPYDAFIMEEDGRLAERLIHEYRGLNLTRPPRLTWVPTIQEALNVLSGKQFDLVIIIPRINDMEAHVLGRQIKQQFPVLPVFLLARNSSRYANDPRYSDRSAFDRMFEWSGNTDLLLALIKHVEDRMNVAHDTRRAQVRVIVLVEDSPFYCSSLLPMLFREIVTQTQTVMEDSVNEEHRILRMRARPKILLAENYEEAETLYRQYRTYLLSIISDVRYPRKGKMDDQAGFSFLSSVRRENPDLPLMMLSSDEANRKLAEAIPAVFINKNSPFLYTDIQHFFRDHLGFGDFIFRLPDGTEVARAENLRKMEKILSEVTNDSVYYHALRNDFSTWLMARSEILLAMKLKPIQASEFFSVSEIKKFLISSIHERRKGRQKGLISDFSFNDFDPDADFIKIGKGSLGNKARGLAFMATQLREHPEIQKKFSECIICVPKTLVISTEGFDMFVEENHLKELSRANPGDEQIIQAFLDAHFPDRLHRDIELFLEQIKYPLAIRSSSLMEDSQFEPFAGIYKTCMIPNQDPDLSKRVSQLIQAIKLVYASTYLEASKSYFKRTLHRMEDEKMAVIIQKLTGRSYDHYFYPAISGVAQSYNFYPISYMKPEEGIAFIALGLGKTVIEGGASLRVSPKYPQFLPHFSTVDDILKTAQRFFYALNLKDFPENFGIDSKGTLVKLEIEGAREHASVKALCSTYVHDEHRIRDATDYSGHPVLTFARVLKYRAFPLGDILLEILDLGRKGMGTPVEIEFAVDNPLADDHPAEFTILQIRPMGVNSHNIEVDIDEKDIQDVFCFSTHAMGNGLYQNIADIIFVKPDTFNPARTVDIAMDIGKINHHIESHSRRYLLIGPGRWGSADHWLGIPVTWKDISSVGGIVETTSDALNADPSQGTHFFHNITSLGICYITVTQNSRDFIDWKWLQSLPTIQETAFIKHIRLNDSITIAIDGRHSKAVIKKLPGSHGAENGRNYT